MEGVEGKISPGLEVVRKYLRKFRLYPGEIKMKKFCVLFVGIVILRLLESLRMVQKKNR